MYTLITIIYKYRVVLSEIVPKDIETVRNLITQRQSTSITNIHGEVIIISSKMMKEYTFKLSTVEYTIH